jgi:hypothetical protein
MDMRMRLLFSSLFALVFAAAGAVGAFAGSGNNAGNSGSTSVQCVVDDGVQVPSSEFLEGPEFSTITVSPTKLWPPNGKMQTIGVSMSFNDDEPDTQTVTILSIGSDQGSSADWTGVGNSATGTADGSTISTSVQLRAQRDDAIQAGRTYDITVQCAEGGTTPGPQNQVTVQVTVPHDQGN